MGVGIVRADASMHRNGTNEHPLERKIPRYEAYEMTEVSHDQAWADCESCT